MRAGQLSPEGPDNTLIGFSEDPIKFSWQRLEEFHMGSCLSWPVLISGWPSPLSPLTGSHSSASAIFWGFFLCFFFGNKDLSIVFHENSSMREGSPPKPGAVASLHYLLSYSILKVRHNITTSCSASPWPCGFYSHSCFQPSQQPPLEEIQWESLLGRRDEAA